MPISFVSLGTYFTAYDGLQDTNFPTPVVENVVGNWKPVSYGHPLKDATMFYAPPSLERVVISGVGSEWTHVTSGVPQGSILGPLMFIMYINDLPSICQHSKILMYADDAKIFRIINSISDCLLLQLDIQRMVERCSCWSVGINTDKCFMISFNNKRLHFVSFT